MTVMSGVLFFIVRLVGGFAGGVLASFVLLWQVAE